MEKKGAHFKVLENRGIEVTGFFEIKNSKGELLKNEGPVYLCRCGHSKNKPFCDGRHKTNGFRG